MANETPAIKPWSSGVAANFIGLFLWVAFYDQFGRVTLGRSADGLRWPALGAAVGGMLAFFCFYLPPAIRGLRAREGFVELARSPFGGSGARWLAGPAIGLAQVGWFAAGTFYATDFTLRGLAATRLLDPSHAAPMTMGGIEVGGPLFLGTAILWGLAFAFVGQYASRLVAAIMNVFPIFPALVLAAATARALYDLPPVRLAGGEASGSWMAFALAVQLVLAFVSGSAPMASEWGAASRDARDVWLGGIVGVAGSAAILAILGMLIVAGRPDRPVAAEGPPPRALKPGVPFSQRPRPAPRRMAATVDRAATVGDVLQSGIGGPAGGAMLFVLAIGSMAPAVFAASSFGKHFSDAVPAVSRNAWTLIGSAIALPLLVFRAPGRWEPFTEVLGALVAPLLGAFAADLIRRPRARPEARAGWNGAGAAAWLIGFAAGMVPMAGRLSGSDRLARLQPSAGLAFVAAFLVHLLAARPAATAPAEPTPPPA